MGSPERFRHFFLTVLLIGLPACLAAFKYAQDGLNADIILNQIMAIHNPTLFYWGQNRLLNLIPFAFQPVRAPVLNLYLVLCAATFSYFTLLWELANCSRFFSGVLGRRISTALIYLLLVSSCIILFKFKAWVEICLWHFEYSLALLLALLNILAIARSRRLVAGFLAGFLGLGLNPVLIVLLVCFLFFRCLYARGLTASEKYATLLWPASFLFWIYLGSFYGTLDNYSTLDVRMLPIALENMAINVTRDYFRPATVLIALFLFLSVSFFSTLNGDWPAAIRRKLNQLPRRTGLYVTFSVLLTGLLYTCVVASIRWFHLNQFAPRYAIPVIYMCLFLLALWMRNVIAVLAYRRWLGRMAAVVLCLFTSWAFYPRSFDITEATIYRECDGRVSASDRLYAGDYWKMWACMSRDMNQGFNSHSLGYRSTSNSEAIREALRVRQKQGKLEILCLDSGQEACERQIRDYCPKATTFGARAINAGTLMLEISCQE